jgi:ribonuclease HI
MTLVHIYCDGACSGNPGRGLMELTAAIEGLKALKFPCEVEIFSDSQYLCYTMAKGWKRKANLDLWQEIDRLCQLHQVTWTWLGRNSTP